MNKTVTANISGIVFYLEVDAYDKLNNYLATIKNYLNNADSRDEIMADIESRIAELFKERFNNERSVVIMSDVDHVIAIMGEPEQYIEDGEPESNFSWENGEPSRGKSKRIFRDEDDKVIGGVCAGIGHYFGIDRIWIRIIFLFAFFVWGVGFIPYLILWIVIPKAKTTAEKLEMKGEAVNVDNIKKTVEDKFNDLKDSFNGEGATKAANGLSNVLSKFFTFIGTVILFILKFFVKFIGVILLIIGIAFLMILLATIFNSEVVNVFTDSGVFQVKSYDIIHAIIGTGTNATLTITAITLLVGIPVIALIYAAIKLLFKVKTNNKAIGLSLVALWVSGVVLSFYVGSVTLSDFKATQKTRETIPVKNNNTLYLNTITEDDNVYGEYQFPPTDSDIWIESERVFYHNLTVDVLPSKGNNIELIVERSADAKSRKLAKERAEKISFTYALTDSLLKISPYIDFKIEDRLRNQKVKVHIMLPIGAKIVLQEGSENVIYDIKNVTNEYDLDMVGETWIMLENGLNCLDCELLPSVSSQSIDTIKTIIQ
jgi:phage shock protein PspC (stress-responsive transcriptional regulator)/DNA-dependent RNA polymerase auxiliary subunit epsilon